MSYPFRPLACFRPDIELLVESRNPLRACAFTLHSRRIGGSVLRALLANVRRPATGRGHGEQKSRADPTFFNYWFEPATSFPPANSKQITRSIRLFERIPSPGGLSQLHEGICASRHHATANSNENIFDCQLTTIASEAS
jgi:hypothetical protein